MEIKRKILERFTEGGLYPYTKFYLRGVKERFGEYWKNHFSTIGLIGMNEACLNLFGENIGSEMGIKFVLKVLDFMRDKLLEFQEETGNNYNLEATPAEGTSYRLAMADKQKYPNIICANEKDYKNGAEPFTQILLNYRLILLTMFLRPLIYRTKFKQNIQAVRYSIFLQEKELKILML